MKSRIYLLTLLIFMMLTGAPAAHAQMENPVRWTVKAVEDASAHTVTLEMTASIDNGWHMYSNLIDPKVGPTPLTIELNDVKGLKPTGALQASKTPIHKFDEVFQADLSWWTGRIVLKRFFDVTGDGYVLKGSIRFQACNDQSCLPPTKEPFDFSGNMKPASSAAMSAEQIPASKDTITIINADDKAAVVADSAAVDEAAAINDLWIPVTFNASNQADDYKSSSMWWLFFTCFIGGFIALLTPCVWPMIPLTVSFFLKKGRAAGELSVML